MFMNFTRWSFCGDFNGITKSIIIVAPHTSYWDAVIGKYVLLKLGIHHKFLSKKQLFWFPFSVILRLFGCVPVGGVKGYNAINEVSKMLRQADNLHIVVCPEGGFAPTRRWNPGFYYMAVKANVPIVVAYIDYKRKEAGIKKIIYNTDNIKQIYCEIRELYSGVTAKYPEKFELPEIK